MNALEAISFERRFTMEDQAAFAAFSGDCNPLHMDALSARRTQAGAPVVHGMHIVLWVLETLFSNEVRMQSPSIRAKFRAPLLVGETAEIRIHERKEGYLARVSVGDASICTIELRARLFLLSPQGPLVDEKCIAEILPDVPLPISFGHAELFSGRIHPKISKSLAFPATEAAIGSGRVQAFGFFSALVGMVCPGLYSLFGSIEVDLAGPSSPWMDFKVVEFDQSFQRIIIEAAGGNLRAKIEAFFRSVPISQTSMEDLSSKVTRTEFAGVNALVVGGSRGLGALCAKLLAAGGAKVLLTYKVGEDDAKSIQREILADGGVCEVMRFDVLNDSFKFPAQFPVITQIYYFATPKIFLTRKHKAFSRQFLNHFTAFYVDGIANLVREIVPHTPGDLRIFNPSSVAIDEHTEGLQEYVMAKTASEILMEYLEQIYPEVHAASYRLPRLLTDQTVSVSPVETEEPLSVLLPLIRAFQRLPAA